MIVRDEAAVISRALRSVREQLDGWAIVDTGSRDATPTIAQRELADVPGCVARQSWLDFGQNRTQSIRLAERQADWLLVLDADETLEGAIELGADASSLEVEVCDGGMSWMSKRFLRSDRRWCYDGACHAVPVSAERDDACQRLDGVRVVHHGDGGCKAGRRQRNIRLLRERMQSRGLDRRSMFYLAQEHRDAGARRSALAAYAERARMGGWEEEVWYSLYQRGLLLEDPREAVGELRRAFELRPHRLEAVVALAARFRELGNARVADTLARLASARARREGLPADRLFVDWRLYERLGAG